MGDRYLVIPCESEPDLAIIWDKVHEQVFDVIDAVQAARFAADDALWSAPSQSLQNERGA